MALVEVESPARGVVWRILASVGEPVCEGRDLMVIRLRKNQTWVTAPSTGTLVGIHVNEGDAVEEGQTLAEIDEVHRRL